MAYCSRTLPPPDRPAAAHSSLPRPARKQHSDNRAHALSNRRHPALLSSEKRERERERGSVTPGLWGQRALLRPGLWGHIGMWGPLTLAHNPVSVFFRQLTTGGSIMGHLLKKFPETGKCESLTISWCFLLVVDRKYSQSTESYVRGRVMWTYERTCYVDITMCT